jgi:hypothetical protein
LLNALGQFGDCRVVIHNRQGQGDVEYIFQPVCQLGRQLRMAAEIKEVVAAADPFDAQ